MDVKFKSKTRLNKHFLYILSRSGRVCRQSLKNVQIKAKIILWKNLQWGYKKRRTERWYQNSCKHCKNVYLKKISAKKCRKFAFLLMITEMIGL
jgi:hypothetical protein